MPAWSTAGRFHAALLRLERLVERSLKTSFPKREIPQIVPYYGYGNRKQVVLRGRVLRDPHTWDATEEDSGFRNFRGMAGNWFTHEIPHAEVIVTFAGQSATTTCDDEGYFLITLPVPGDFNHSEPWHPFSARLASGGEEFTGRARFLPESARRLIISDIDDTVIETGASQLWQMIKTTLLENEHTRKIFPGVSRFYRDLRNGPSGNEQNPIFYVTSSPWNLRAFIMSVFQSRNTPHGPAFMTDWGLGPTKILKHGHGTHKLNAIQNILDFYDHSPAVLIGDSGEQDPEIYTTIVHNNPGRIEAIFIRDVSANSRDADIAELATQCALQNVELKLVANTGEAHTHASAMGLIHRPSPLP
ncbi:MAG: App1 family protein [Verrucomicrobiaceae bacterium]